MTGEQYYFFQLPNSQKELYLSLYNGLKTLSSSIRIPWSDGETISKVFFQLRLDHPEIFYVVGYSCKASYGADSMIFLPEYMFQKQKINDHRKAIETRLERIIRPAREMTEIQREQYIHDYILENIKYDKLEKPYSHEIIGPLNNGVGVCEGIAKTVKLMCNALDIPCMIPVSDRDRANGEKYLHAWNIVTIGGTHYHVDATFDNTLSKNGTNRYDYFNLSDESIFRDHRALKYNAPQCTDGKHFWYREHKLSFTKLDEIENRIDQTIRKKNRIFVFHWRGSHLTKEMLLEICRRIELVSHNRNKGAVILVNWPQSVLQVNISDRGPLSVIDLDAGEDVQ